MKKRLITIFMAMMFTIPLILYGADIVTVKKTQNKTYKQVKFSHKLHKSKGVKKCKQCHHKGKPSLSCANKGCHKGPAGTAKIHKMCYKGCHKQRGGPTKCKDCHKY